MISTGETPIATSNDTAVQLFAAQTGPFFQHLTILVEEPTKGAGTKPGFWSIDGGATWCRFPAAASGHSSFTLDSLGIGKDAVQFKRVPGGADVTNIYAWMW